MKESLKKRGLHVRQARKMVQDKSEWQGFVKGDESLTLMRCHSCGSLQLYEALEGWKSIYSQVYNLKGIKEKFSVFLVL